MVGEIRKRWSGAALLGEGPTWDSRSGLLWFVDIKKKLVHRFDPRTDAVTSWPAPAKIGWIFPADDGGMVAGLQTGLSRFDPTSGTFTQFSNVEADRPNNRLNDATIGPNGVIWFGSMDDGEQQATGQVYRFDGNNVSKTSIPPVPIVNGPALSPDGKTLYHVDTVGRVIHAISLSDDGAIVDTREFVRFSAKDGNPDGVTADAEGNIWVGVWGGWCVRCFAPDGVLLDEVRLPASNVTKVAFGDADLKTAYVTTASIGLDVDELAAQPDAGALFSFRVKVAGQSLPQARSPGVGLGNAVQPLPNDNLSD